VLVLRESGETLEVAILTRNPQLGNIPIAHRKGLSYMTGAIAEVPREALAGYIGDWERFDDFMAGRPLTERRGRSCAWLTLILIFLVGIALVAAALLGKLSLP